MIRRADKARFWLAETPAFRKKNRTLRLLFNPDAKPTSVVTLDRLLLNGKPTDPRTAYRMILSESERIPVQLARIAPRQYWYYKKRIWWDSEDLEASAVRALLDDRERKRSRQIARAHAASQLPVSGELPSRRQPIPDDVKMFVWQRDHGQCVRCSSAESLEFDHIIPVVMGGSNTARNLQLLCEACNRTKGGHLA